MALLWVAAWGLARVQEYAPHASLWFPPAGLTFGAAIVLGWRGLPGVLFASIAVTLSGLFYADSPPWPPLLAAGVAFGLAHGLSYFLAGRALLRWGEARPTPKTVTLFLVLAPLAALAATAGGVGALSAFGVVDGRTDLVAIGVPWWIGDFVGVVALGPFFAVLLTRLLGSTLPVPETLRATFQADTGSPGVRTSLLKLAVGLVPLVVSAILVAAWPAQAHASSFLVFFAIIPLTWIAHTEGVARTTLAAAVLSTATAGVGALLGPGITDSPTSSPSSSSRGRCTSASPSPFSTPTTGTCAAASPPTR